MTEAEYIALTKTFKEVIWMRRLLHEIENCDVERSSADIQRFHDISTIQWEQMEDVDPPQSSRAATTIFVDKQGDMKLAENPQFHNRTKHIDIGYHFIQDTLAAGEIVVQDLPTADMVAEIMTKPLPSEKHKEHSGAMGLQSASAKITPEGVDDEDAVTLD